MNPWKTNLFSQSERQSISLVIQALSGNPVLIAHPLVRSESESALRSTTWRRARPSSADVTKVPEYKGVACKTATGHQLLELSKLALDKGKPHGPVQSGCKVGSVPGFGFGFRVPLVPELD